MDDTQDAHPDADDSEDGPEVIEQRVAVGRAEEVISRHEGAALGMELQVPVCSSRRRIKAVAASGWSRAR
jgi:hypothetical protein